MLRTKRWLSHFEVARSTPHRAPPHHPTARDKQRVRCDAAPLPPSFPTRRMHCLPLVRVRLLTVSTNRSFPSGYPALLVRSRLCCLTWCPYTPHGPTLPSCRPSPCVCARPVCPSYACASAAPPLPLPQARAARARFPSCLPAPLRAARTNQDPDTCARTRGELGGGGGARKGEEMSHGQELGYGAWPSGWRRSLRNGW